MASVKRPRKSIRGGLCDAEITNWKQQSKC